MALYAELDVPDLPEGKLTVVTPHLENRAKPSVRKAQLTQVLEEIHDIDHPVIVASDFNTTGTDFSPKTFTGLLQQAFLSEDMTPELIAVAATPIGLQYSVLHFGIQIAHNQADPTVTGIPVLAPNYERPLFELVEEYRFADGRSFDLRGDVERTHDGVHTGKLANSNDRADKGFEPTFETGTMGFLGEFKLDWMLVKSYTHDPFAPGQTYRLAPHGAWVLKLLNNAPVERLSDHHPMAVTLPFEEPDVRKPGPRQVAPGTVPEWARERLRQRRASKEAAEPPADLSTIALGEYTCGEHIALVDESPGVAGVRNIWGLGYHYGRSGLDQTWPTITYDKVVRFMDRIQTLCQERPEELWFEIIRGLPPERARGGITTFFDLRPGQYTCEQHLDLAASESQLAETRAVWADGYDAVHRGIDATSPPITANDLVAYADSILAKCRENPEELWIRVVRHDEVHAQAAELELGWDELASTTYHGIYDAPVTLEDGVYEVRARTGDARPRLRPRRPSPWRRTRRSGGAAERKLGRHRLELVPRRRRPRERRRRQSRHRARRRSGAGDGRAHRGWPHRARCRPGGTGRRQVLSVAKSDPEVDDWWELRRYEKSRPSSRERCRSPTSKTWTGC